jgi:5-methyltetrahydropteroyltriglutamate--homocysteine methyltransferase
MGKPPFRADHIGSLLRPAALRQAFREHAAGKMDDRTFRKIQDDCVREVVKLQEDLGLKVVTDGEFRRGSYWGRFVERIEGFAIKPAAFKFRDDQGHEIEFTAPYAAEKLKRTRALAVDEFVALRDMTGVTAKITLPSPSTMHFFRWSDFADRSAYPTVEGFLADLGEVFRQEISELAKAGCRYIQFDEVAIAQLCDPSIRKLVADSGEKPERLVDLYIDCINDAVAGVPSHVTFGVHVCRGNFKGHYLAAGGYEWAAKRLFQRTKVNHFLLEYDTERAGDFRPLRFAKDAGVVLGLISSKSPVLEELGFLKRLIEDATVHIDGDRLAVSPQCGFASTAAGNPLTEADQRAKLTLVVKAAREIWDSA